MTAHRQPPRRFWLGVGGVAVFQFADAFPQILDYGQQLGFGGGAAFLDALGVAFLMAQGAAFLMAQGAAFLVAQGAAFLDTLGAAISVTPQSNKLDTDLLRHKTVSRYNYVMSQGNIPIQ